MNPKISLAILLILICSVCYGKTEYAHPVICGGGFTDKYGVSWSYENESGTVCCYRPFYSKENGQAYEQPEPDKSEWCDNAWIPYSIYDPVWMRRETYCYETNLGDELYANGTATDEEGQTWRCLHP